MRKKILQPTLVDDLRTAIDQSGLTLYRICKIAGVDVPNLQRFVRGDMIMRLDTAAAIAAALGYRLIRDPDAVPPTPTPANLARPMLSKRSAKRRKSSK